MRRYIMFAFGSFDKFMGEIYYTERESFEIPVTIGLIVADLRQQYCRENLFNYLDHFNKFSSDYINFYIPGYCSLEEMSILRNNGYDRYYGSYYNLKGKNYLFSEQYFDEFIFKLREEYNIIYQGIPELILVEVLNGKIKWDNKIRFQLSAAEKEGQIKTIYSFFDDIFSYAKKYVNIRDFSKIGRQDKLKESFVEIVKRKIPEPFIKLYENDEIYRIK